MTDKTTTTARKPFGVRLRDGGADIWSGPTDNDVILGAVYDKGPGSYDHEEMARVWAAAYPVMFPALARIRDRARAAITTDGHYALLDLAWIAEEAAAALPGPTIGDLMNGTSPAAPSPAPAAPSAAQGWMPIETAPKDRLLLLACADWPHSTVLGKPVPVKVGGWHDHRGYWEIFGASWKPTHWMPLPVAPGAQPAQPDALADGQEARAIIADMAKAGIQGRTAAPRPAQDMTETARELDSAIAHADEIGAACGPCAAEHRRLAAWLRELRDIRAAQPVGEVVEAAIASWRDLQSADTAKGRVIARGRHMVAMNVLAGLPNETVVDGDIGQDPVMRRMTDDEVRAALRSGEGR